MLDLIRDLGIDISSGQLNEILTENKEDFHLEKDGILSAGLAVSPFIQTDDTGARHAGKNGYCKTDFDLLFSRKTCFISLNLALGRIAKNKEELLRVLDHPETPLHNNGCETDIRDRVSQRKVSGGTQSDLGRRARDIFASLKRTCRKLGVSFWKYLNDRNAAVNHTPQLSQLIIERAAALA